MLRMVKLQRAELRARGASYARLAAQRGANSLPTR